LLHQHQTPKQNENGNDHPGSKFHPLRKRSFRR